MHSERLPDADVHIQHDRPNRKEYRLSRSGKQALARRLDSPAALPRIHHEFIHKLFLLDHLDQDRRIRFVEVYISTFRTWAAQLAQVDEKFSSTPHEQYVQTAECQLMALRHLRRLVDCEIASAQDILADVRDGRAQAPRAHASRRRVGRRLVVLTDLTMVTAEYSRTDNEPAAETLP